MHLKPIILFALMTIGLSMPAFPQIEDGYYSKKNQFRLGLGTGYIKTLDLQFSPNIYHSIRPNLDITYLRKKATGNFQFDFNLLTGTLKSSSGTSNTISLNHIDFLGQETVEKITLNYPQILADVKVNYLQKISSISNEKRRLYLGGNIQEHLTLSPGLINIGTINYVSLNLGTQADLQLRNGKYLTAMFEFPLTSVVTRLPYHNAPAIPGKSDIAAVFTGHNKFETAGRFQNINLSLRYPLVLRSTMAVDISYKLQWIHYSVPFHLTERGSYFILGFNF